MFTLLFRINNLVFLGIKLQKQSPMKNCSCHVFISIFNSFCKLLNMYVFHSFDWKQIRTKSPLCFDAWNLIRKLQILVRKCSYFFCVLLFREGRGKNYIMKKKNNCGVSILQGCQSSWILNSYSSGAVGGKTGKTLVLPGFSKIERGGGSGGMPQCNSGLT